MYKVVTAEGSCGSPYNLRLVEEHANRMASSGYDLVQVYESRVGTCFGPKSVLVMIFRQR